MAYVITKYILIVILSSTGVASQVAEFDSKETCQLAAQTVVDMNNDNPNLTAKAVCLPK